MLPKQLLIIAATMVILVTAWGASAFVTDCLPIIGGQGCTKQVKSSLIAHTITPSPTTEKRKVLITPIKKNNTIQKKKPTPTPTVSKQLATKVTTKGGLPVYAPLNVKINPPTGPEMLPLLDLIPTGILGFLLIKKAKK